MIRFISNGYEETIIFGRVFSRLLQEGDVVLLSGELGSGKTCFVRGVASGLQVRERVSSPSFVFIHEYYGRIPLVHIDLYRLNGVDVWSLGLEETVGNDRIGLVEWGEKAEALFNFTARIKFEILDEKQRVIDIELLNLEREEKLGREMKNEGLGN